MAATEDSSERMSAREWFGIYIVAVRWASDELRDGCPSGFSISRENRHAVLSRNTSSGFARNVRAMGNALARGAKVLRDGRAE